MHKRRIAFIVEGENREQMIFHNIQKIFFSDKTPLDIFTLSAKQNIYMLAQKLRKEPYMDTIEVLRECDEEAKKKLEGLTRDSFQEIYLFFDYDGHTNNISDAKKRKSAIEDMLQIFDNETEQGKLYISYPMVEALRDVAVENICYTRCSVGIFQEDMRQYKHDSALNEKYVHIKKYDWEKWKELFQYYWKRINCLMPYTTDSNMSRLEFLRTITSNNIYKEQYDKFIGLHGRVFILSAFPQFILEYFKEESLKQIAQSSSKDSCRQGIRAEIL